MVKKNIFKRLFGHNDVEPEVVKGKYHLHSYMRGRGAESLEARFIKTHVDAVLPKAAHDDALTGDSGYDLVSVEDAMIPAKCSAIIPVGLKLAFLTPGFWFKIQGRSGLGFKNGLQPHLGVIDNGYRGDLGVKLYNFSDVDCKLPKGKAIAQIVFYPLIQPTMLWTLDALDTKRGEGGFGHTG